MKYEVKLKPVNIKVWTIDCIKELDWASATSPKENALPPAPRKLS